MEQGMLHTEPRKLGRGEGSPSLLALVQGQSLLLMALSGIGSQVRKGVCVSCS